MRRRWDIHPEHIQTLIIYTSSMIQSTKSTWPEHKGFMVSNNKAWDALLETLLKWVYMKTDGTLGAEAYPATFPQLTFFPKFTIKQTQLFNSKCSTSLFFIFFLDESVGKKKKMTAVPRQNTVTIQMDWVCYSQSLRGAHVSKHKATSFCTPPHHTSSFQPKKVIRACSRAGHISTLHVTKTQTHWFRQKQLLHWCCSLFSTLSVKYRDNFWAKPFGKELYSKSLVLCLAQ